MTIDTILIKGICGLEHKKNPKMLYSIRDSTDKCVITVIGHIFQQNHIQDDIILVKP